MRTASQLPRGRPLMIQHHVTCLLLFVWRPVLLWGWDIQITASAYVLPNDDVLDCRQLEPT